MPLLCPPHFPLAPSSPSPEHRISGLPTIKACCIGAAIPAPWPGKHVNWSDRREVSLDELRTLPIGDPWLSAGLLKDGDPIYLVKWESDWPQPRLLHIQSIKDVELFGINGSNYGNFILEKATWESRYGFAAATLERGVLAAAVPTVTPTVVPTAAPTSVPTASPRPRSYPNCTELRRDYPNGVPASHPAYSSRLDRDRDGWACER